MLKSWQFQQIPKGMATQLFISISYLSSLLHFSDMIAEYYAEYHKKNEQGPIEMYKYEFMWTNKT